MSHAGSNKKVSNSLLALSSAAILAVYTAGYSRTQSAANRFAAADGRRPTIPIARDTISRDTIPLPPPPVAAPPAAETKPERPVRREAESPREPKPEIATVPTTPVDTPAAPPPPAEPAPVVVEQKPPEPKVEVAVAAPPPAAPVTPPTPAAPPPHPGWKDGTYTGWGYSRHGDIQAAVVIEGGRIASATIAQCNTRYSCSVINDLIPQPAKRQSPEVDNVSGATQSADAFYFAVVEALAKAK